MAKGSRRRAEREKIKYLREPVYFMQYRNVTERAELRTRPPADGGVLCLRLEAKKGERINFLLLVPP
jgi:hypothetical protein